MSVAVHAGDVVADALRARRRDERLLAWTLAASALVHTAAVVLVPGSRRPDVEPPRPLQVVIAKPLPEPVRIEPPPKPKPPPPPLRTPSAKPEPQPRPAPAPAAAPERKPVLALPESAAPAAPVFTVPQAAPAEPAPTESKPAAVAAGPSAPARPRETQSTPPVHDAAYLNNPKPRYPLFARRSGIEGTVYLRVLVSRDGRPLQVNVERSSGSAALEAVRGYKFVPARQGQEPVEQSVTVPVVFRLDNAS